MTAERANPFADLSDFAPKPANQAGVPVDTAKLDRVALDNNFPSRQAKPPAPAKPAVERVPVSKAAPRKAGRRYTTGRSQQINIKATSETIERLYRLADARNIPLGELLEQALQALEAQEKVFLEKQR